VRGGWVEGTRERGGGREREREREERQERERGERGRREEGRRSLSLSCPRYLYPDTTKTQAG
jgi:hypothetical protein